MQEESERIPNKTRSAQMRARLMAAARALFVEKGFAETGTPEIVKRAEVTRGALYHHFTDKADLFRAVVMAEAEAVATEIEAAAQIGQDPGVALRDGTRAYFAAMSKPGRARLLLQDGPSVLGWQTMAEVDAGSGQASLREGLRLAAPSLDADQLDATATVLSAAFDRAALAIADGNKAAPYEAALFRIMDGLGDP